MHLLLISSRGLRFLQTLVLCFLLCPFPLGLPRAIAEPPDDVRANANRKSCLRLLKEPIVTIDQISGTGDTTLDFRNETSKTVEMALIGTVTTPSTSRARVKFAADSKSTPTAIYTQNVAPKTNASVRLVVENAWDDGEFDIEIANHYGTESSGTVHARRFPISIRLDGLDRLKLALSDSISTGIPVRNDDDLQYPVEWRLINGEVVCNGETVLKPKAPTFLECTPHLNKTLTRFLNLLKQDTSRDGYRLVLLPPSSLASTSESALHPLKTFSAEASVDFFAPFTRAAATYTFLIIVLIAGGSSSLILSYLLPNKLARLDLKEQLMKLAERTADLSTKIESKLAVLVRLERRRLVDLLHSRTVLSPDFSTVIVQCASGITRLAAKVTVLEQMDVVLGRLGRKLAAGVPPTKVDAINAMLEDAAVELSKAEVSDDDIKAAGQKVGAASALVDSLAEPDDPFAQKLGERVRAFLGAQNAVFFASPTYASFRAQLPGPEVLLRTVDLTIPVPSDQHFEVDVALWRMLIIRDYVLLFDQTTNEDVRARLTARQVQLISYLQTTSWDGLRSARLLIREMQDDVFPERLLDALRSPGEVSIGMDPSVAYERSPLEFYVFFQKSALNTSAAREELRVLWDFGDNLKEGGWNVSHYFQLRSSVHKFTVRTHFHDNNGQIVNDAHGDPVTISYDVEVLPSESGRRVGERTRTELLKLTAALLIAVFGLVSGAQEQIAKLDILPGMIAIFLLGFSADSIKRLLTATKTQNP